MLSINVSAKDHIMKVAFVGEPNLKSEIIKKIFGNCNTSHRDGNDIWGFRPITITSGDNISTNDAVLYRFRNAGLDAYLPSDETLRDCDIVFLVFDFSHENNLNEILTDRFLNIRGVSGGKKIVLIANNIYCLPYSDRIRAEQQINDARILFGENNFNFIMPRSDEDDETFRNNFFDASDEMINWKELPEARGDDLPIEVSNKVENAKNRQFINDLQRKVNEHDIKINEHDRIIAEMREEFRRRIEGLGNDSWKVLEQMVNILTRYGYIDSSNSNEFRQYISNLSSRYGTFEVAINEQINNMRNDIDTISNEVNDYKQETAALSTNTRNFFDNMVERIDRLAESLNNVTSNIDVWTQRIREIDSRTSHQTSELLDRIYEIAPVLVELEKLSGIYEEFMHYTETSNSLLPDTIASKLKGEIRKNYEKLNGFEKFCHWVLGTKDLFR